MRGLERRLVKDIPQDAQDTVLADLQQYSVTLLGVVVSQERMRAQPIGSGTLVLVDNQPAILTAGHVVYNAEWDLRLTKEFSHLGIAFREVEECPKFELEKLSISGKWNRGKNPSASDWAFVFLPPDSIGYLKANKKFLGLSSLSIESTNLIYKERIAVLMGTPAKWCKQDTETRKDHQHWDLGCMCGLGGITDLRKPADSKILEFDAVFDEYYGGPAKFGGVSGGSLWLVDVQEVEPATFAVANKEFVGVPYWEVRIEKKKKITIFCHEISGILKEYASARES
jgi:hypothetical protein